MRLVGVSQRVDFLSNRSEYRDGLDQRLIAFIKLSGFLPVPVPNKLILSSDRDKRKKELLNWVKGLDLSAFVLSGGNDVSDNKERDDNENWLLDYAEDKKLPVLGICRGMQILGVRNGGLLKSIDHHSNSLHEIKGKISGSVNSFHKFSFEQLPNDFNLLAKAKDGCIEAIEHKKMPWEGWMWHPERFETFRKSDVERLKYIFKAVA